MKEQLSGCAYGLGGEAVRIPWSFSKRPSGISLNQPCVDPRLQRMSITAPLVFAAISSEWNWDPGEIGFTGSFISEQQSPGVSNIVFGWFAVFIRHLTFARLVRHFGQLSNLHNHAARDVPQ